MSFAGAEFQYAEKSLQDQPGEPDLPDEGQSLTVTVQSTVKGKTTCGGVDTPIFSLTLTASEIRRFLISKDTNSENLLHDA